MGLNWHMVQKLGTLRENITKYLGPCSVLIGLYPFAQTAWLDKWPSGILDQFLIRASGSILLWDKKNVQAGYQKCSPIRSTRHPKV